MEEAVMVVGVDTHKESHSAALLDELGSVRSSARVSACGSGYRELLGWAQAHSQRRVWAVEGTGSYGAGLAAYLSQQGESVFEGDHPKRPARGAKGKSDELDAIRVARELLSKEHHALPRGRGEREAIRVLLSSRESAVRAHTEALNHLQALVATAPDELREQLRRLRSKRLVKACLRLRPGGQPEFVATAFALRSVAQRVEALQTEADAYEKLLGQLVSSAAPALLSQSGVGIPTAAQILVSWSYAGRIRNADAFAVLAGVAPIPASSGKTQRHRLSRLGDRQLNRALHTVALSRSRWDQATKAYIARRTAEGKSARDIRRCLKRYIARRLFRLLEALDNA